MSVGSAVGEGVAAVFLGVGLALGPGVDGVDVEEDVDNWIGLVGGCRGRVYGHTEEEDKGNAVEDQHV